MTEEQTPIFRFKAIRGVTRFELDWDRGVAILNLRVEGEVLKVEEELANLGDIDFEIVFLKTVEDEG